MLNKLQNEIKAWTEKNFPDATAEEQFIGVVEEVGELAHAILKLKQGIRGTEQQLIEEEHDAIGDIAIYLINYCERRGYDFEKILAVTWEQVQSRDWKADPIAGGDRGKKSAAEDIAQAAIDYIMAEWKADNLAADFDEISSMEEEPAIEELWRTHEYLEDAVSKVIEE